MGNATWIIVENADDALTIRDECKPWNMSITNDAENVVKALFSQGLITNEKRLYYYDSAGDLDELVHKDGKFVTFAPGPR